MTDRAAPTINAIRDVLARCNSIDESVEALAAELRPRFLVDRASVRILDPDGMHLVLVSVWSSTRSNLHVGTRVRTAATSFDALLAGRDPVFSETPPGADPPPLLDQILLSEGLQSWVSCPLEQQGRPVGILSFSSRTDGAFRSSDAPFFTELGRACQHQLVRQAWEALPDVPDRAHAEGGERIESSGLVWRWAR